MQVQPLVPWRRTLPCPPFISMGQSITVACSVITGGPALSAFLIFHSSECADVVNMPGGSGAVAEDKSSPTVSLRAGSVSGNASANAAVLADASVLALEAGAPTATGAAISTRPNVPTAADMAAWVVLMIAKTSESVMPAIFSTVVMIVPSITGLVKYV